MQTPKGTRDYFGTDAKKFGAIVVTLLLYLFRTTCLDSDIFNLVLQKQSLNQS